MSPWQRYDTVLVSGGRIRFHMRSQVCSVVVEENKLCFKNSFVVRVYVLINLSLNRITDKESHYMFLGGGRREGGRTFNITNVEKIV